MRRLTWLVACSLLAVVAAVAQDDQGTAPSMSINDLMLTVITPATNTLWGIEDPQTAEDWQLFIDAANLVIDAGNTMKAGGTGPRDNEWASNAAWQAFTDTLIGAGLAAREAAVNQDIEAMYTAGEVLYPPCEDCHNQFHPGVAGQ